MPAALVLAYSIGTEVRVIGAAENVIVEPWANCCSCGYGRGDSGDSCNCSHVEGLSKSYVGYGRHADNAIMMATIIRQP